MSIRDILHKRMCENVYGDIMKNKWIRKRGLFGEDDEMNENPFRQTHPFMSGGDGDATTQTSSSTSPNLDFKIEDTFTKYHTNSILFGKHITPYAKKVIFEVIKYYQNKDISGNTDLKRKIIKYLHKVFEDKELNYDKLMTKFNAQTNECLMAYMLIAYQSDNLDLMLRTMYTFGRVLPLDYKTEWFDNYRLNAYGNVYNMVMWKQFDANDVYTIDEEPKPIDKSVKIPFNKVIKYFVGSLRAFIIDHELYPSNVASSSPPTSFSGGDVEAIISPSDAHKGNDPTSKNKTAEQICDECYLHYPFYFGGSHGCDVFSLGMTLTVEEIKQFLDRYPSARVGYILNTSTYRSGKGEHWVAVEFTHGKAKMICSQQSDFSAFHDGGELKKKIREICYGEEWNNRLIQMDNHACGMYSAMALLQLLRFGSIDKAVDAIGVNMENLGHSVGKASNVEIVIDKLAGVK